MDRFLQRTVVRIPVLVAITALAACKPAPEASLPAIPAAPAFVAGADVHPFAIGDLQAAALRDGGVQLPNDNQVFGMGRTPAEVAAVLAAAGLATDQLSLSIQPLAVKSADRVLLFDAGAGAAMGEGAGKLPASLAAAGVTADAVTDVFISHLHGDHIAGLIDAAGALRFPNASVHISAAEWKFLGDLKPEQAQGFGVPDQAVLVAAVTPKVVAFAPGAELIPGVVRAVDVQGHTPGHSAYLIGSGADAILYVGDSMHHSVVSVQKPEWHVAFDNDKPTAAASRAALIADSAAKGQRIYAVHFPWPGVGRITRQGEAYAWSAE